MQQSDDNEETKLIVPEEPADAYFNNGTEQSRYDGLENERTSSL